MDKVYQVKLDVDDFIAKNTDKYEIISSFQDQINHITADTYQSTVQYIKNNSEVLFKNKESSLIFFYCLYHFSLYNYKQLELILDLAIEFSCEMRNNGLTDIDFIAICSYFINSLNYLFYKKLISIESIIQHSYQNKILFINFYPEIEQYDPEYANMRSELLFNDFDQENEELRNFFKLIKSNPQEHIENRNKNYHPSKLHKSIREDDIETFQELLSQNNYTVNHKIEHSYYERTSTCDRNVSLIQIAAVYGSIKVFKFLWMQNDIILDDNLQFYTYSGRNFEIIHICEEKCPFLNAIDFAINTHQNELVDYFLDNFQEENEEDESLENVEEDDNPYKNLSKKSLQQALKSLNYKIILPSLKRIVNIVNNTEGKENKNAWIMFFRPERVMLESCLFDLDLFKFIYNLNRERYISIDSNTQIYSHALFTGAYDAVRYMLNQSDKKFLFDYFGRFLRSDTHAADMILDILDQEEYKGNFIIPVIDFESDLFYDSLKKYNENVVAKMICKFKWTHKMQNKFRKESLNYLSPKMIVSLCRNLSSTVDKKTLSNFIDFYILHIRNEEFKSNLVEIKNLLY